MRYKFGDGSTGEHDAVEVLRQFASQCERLAALASFRQSYGIVFEGEARDGPGPKYYEQRAHYYKEGAKRWYRLDESLYIQVRTDNGGVNYFDGSWAITGGSGAFEGLRGQGTLMVAIGSNANVPPPAEYAREELVGSVKQ